jgi:hypothetical protein
MPEESLRSWVTKQKWDSSHQAFQFDTVFLRIKSFIETLAPSIHSKFHCPYSPGDSSIIVLGAEEQNL